MADYLQIGSLRLDGGIRCLDWSDLFASPPKRGSNRIIAGETGRFARTRVMDEARVALVLQLYGTLNVNGTAFTGDQAENVYTLFNSLRAIADLTTVQALSFVGRGVTTVDCIVEELTSPRFQAPRFARCVLDVTLPDGPVDLSKVT